MQKVHLIVPPSFASVVLVSQQEDSLLWLRVGLEIGQTLRDIWDNFNLRTKKHGLVVLTSTSC